MSAFIPKTPHVFLRRQTIATCLLFGSVAACSPAPTERHRDSAGDSSQDSFQHAFNAGASCETLFKIRNDTDPKAPGRSRMNEMLGSVGCLSPSSKRTSTRSGGNDVYSINYRASYSVCSGDASATYRQAGTTEPEAAARWLANGQKGEGHQGTYEGCLDALRGNGSRFPLPKPPEPPPNASAAYKTVENALKKAGVRVCSFIRFGDNPGYGYLETRTYFISKGACPPDGTRTEGNPRFGEVSVEIYANQAMVQRGVSTHENEMINGRPFSGAAWSREEAVIEVTHHLHPAMAKTVERAMRSAVAERRYFRFE